MERASEPTFGGFDLVVVCLEGGLVQGWVSPPVGIGVFNNTVNIAGSRGYRENKWVENIHVQVVFEFLASLVKCLAESRRTEGVIGGCLKGQKQQKHTTPGIPQSSPT